MFLEVIGIGAIIGATIVTVTNIILHLQNRKYELSKEQLTKLYNPLNALIKKKHKHLGFLKIKKNKFEEYAVEKYQFFLELRDIYLEHEVYSSLALHAAFHTLQHNHEMEYYNYSNKCANENEILKYLALFEMTLNIGEDGQSEFEQKLEKLIEVVQNDLYDIYHQKPVTRYFRY